MREIKFRGKVRKTELFETVNDTYPINKDYWVYGWLVKDADGETFILPADETHVDDKDNKLYFDGVPIIPEVDPETVGQYTGLKDKNGREIYEGDVVATVFYGCRYVQEVVWSDVTNGFSFRSNGCGPIFHKSLYMEVIGNIHDRSATQGDACQSKNPELLSP